MCALIYGGPEHHRNISSSMTTKKFTCSRNFRGGGGVVVFFVLGSFWVAVIFALSDLSLHRFPEHACQSWLPWVKGQYSPSPG